MRLKFVIQSTLKCVIACIVVTLIVREFMTLFGYTHTHNGRTAKDEFSVNPSGVIKIVDAQNSSVDYANGEAKYQRMIVGLEEKRKINSSDLIGSKNELDRIEIHHVAYLKVHKVGSSTIQNIFLRFVDSRNLTMVFGHTPDHPFAGSMYQNVISFSDSLNGKNIVGPPPGQHFDILCCHVIFNETQFKRFMPHDSVYIGLVREPFRRLESSMNYFGSSKNINMSDFAKEPLRYDRTMPSMCNNRMAFAFGFPLSLFPTPDQPIPDKSKVKSYVREIHRQFDLILINERLAESLVYMRRMLRWKLEDIIYLSQNIAGKTPRRFTAEDKKNMEMYLYLDIALYNSSLELFEYRFNQLGQDAVDEVAFFKAVLERTQDFCFNTTVDNVTIEESKWSEEIRLTRPKCKLYTLFETTFVHNLRLKTYGVKKN